MVLSSSNILFSSKRRFSSWFLANSSTSANLLFSSTGSSKRDFSKQFTVILPFKTAVLHGERLVALSSRATSMTPSYLRKQSPYVARLRSNSHCLPRFSPNKQSVVLIGVKFELPSGCEILEVIEKTWPMLISLLRSTLLYLSADKVLIPPAITHWRVMSSILTLLAIWFS